MSWLPRIGLFGATTTDPWDDDLPDAHGATLVIVWIGFVVEFGLARIERSLPSTDGDLL